MSKVYTDKPDHEPRMAYVLMTQYGAAFAHEDFDRVAKRATDLLRANADDRNTPVHDLHRIWIERVEAE